MAPPDYQIPWLPLAKAAEKISELTHKQQSERDALAAALEGDLTLSVQINSPTPARSGQFLDSSEESPCGVSTKRLDREGVGFMGIEGEVFAYSTNKVEEIQGLLNLLLIGNGKTHIENLALGIQDGGEALGGIYLKVSMESDTVWELQEKLVNTPSSHARQPSYAPAERFRDDWRIVVRTSELDKFTEQINQSNNTSTLAHSLKGIIIPQQQKFRWLCIDELRKFARRWVMDFPNIPMKGISLYEHHSRWSVYFKRRDQDIRVPLYVVVFEIPGLEWPPPCPDLKNWPPTAEDILAPSLLDGHPWRDFLEKLDNVPGRKIQENSHFLNPGFEQVYNSMPASTWRDDWLFVAVDDVGSLPDYVDRNGPTLVLLPFDPAEETLALVEKQPPADQGAPVTEQGVDVQSLETLKTNPGAMESVPIQRLCRSFGYGPRSSTGVVEKLKEYNKRFPENPIHFHKGKGGARCLYQYESWYIISKVGESTGRRKPRKSRKDKP